VSYPSPSRLILPVLLLAVAWAGHSNFTAAAAAYGQLAHQLPYVVLAIAAVLALQFNRSKFIGAASTLAMVYWLIQSFLQTSLQQPQAFFTYNAITLAAPLLLMLIALLPERGVFNLYGLCLLLMPVILLIFGMMLLRFDVELFHNYDRLQVKPLPGYILSIAASGVFLFATLVMILLLSLRDSETEIALLASQVFLFCTLAFLHQPMISVVMISTAGICLIISLIKSSHDMAYRDELTGLRGRRALNERLRGLGKRYAVAMMDVDHFKKFNDSYGHDVGDDVLKVVAKQIDQVAGGGTAYRYGGEEFSIVFPGKTAKSCVPYLEVVREAIADYEILLRDQNRRPEDQKEGKRQRGRNKKAKSVSVTISIGVAERNDSNSQPEEVIKAADKALYKAKKNGRNCLAQ
jgi:GGDEF domain-containing protein